MFEIMTVLCLLFASWTRQEKQSSDAQQVATLESLTYRANAALASLELALNQANDAKQATLAELNQYSQTLVAQTQQQLEQGAHTVHEATAKLIDIKKSAISDLANYTERLQASVEHADQLHLALTNANTDAVSNLQNMENTMLAMQQSAQKANQTIAQLNLNQNQTTQLLNDLTALIQSANDTESKLDNSHASAIRTLSNLQVQIEEAKNCKLSFAPANQLVQMSESEHDNKFTKSDLIFALKNRLIPTNERNRLPVDYLKSKTGLGKPTIMQVLDECEKLGILTNTGNGYTYADEASVSSIQTMPANVVSLRSK
jgi:chromosome segregation ATPase